MSRCVRPLICPVCGEGLEKEGRTLRCPAGHAFDLSRDGYVNLLLGKAPATLGDGKEMLRARRRFLGNGHYQPLSDAINARVLAYFEDHLPGPVADIGCGEGYYLGRLAQALPDVCCFGVDVAKEAARMAAKRVPAGRFFVANVWDKILFADASIRVLLNVFAPRNPAEFGRVLAPDGQLFIAIPAPDHLQALRSQRDLLAIEEDKREKLIAQLADGFHLADETALAYDLHLDESDAIDLLQMTPNDWHLSEEERERLHFPGGIHVRASFILLAFSH